MATDDQFPPLDTTAASKLDRLRARLRSLGSALVAFSGGVDSTFLLAVAAEELPDRLLAVTAESPTYPAWELDEAKQLAARLGVPQRLVQTSELEDPRYVRNDPDRCYYCKTDLFGGLVELAATEGLAEVLDGTTADDLDDHRPGRRAAREQGVISPLMEVGLEKEEIRLLSRRMGLPTADKPSFACLASRFPYGTAITEELLDRVGRAEGVLRKQGFTQYRVRHHGEVARIELNEAELERIVTPEIRNRLVGELKALGYLYVTVDLQGYRSGSLNEPLGSS